VWIDLAAAENLFGTSGIYQFAWANVSPGINAEEVQALLQKDPRLVDRYQVYFVDHLYEQYTQALDDIAGISTVLVLLSLIMVMFGTYGSIYLTLAERACELTILRAIGFSSRSIRSILTARTLIQVIAAFTASWILATLILKYLSDVYPIVVHAILLEVKITPGMFLIGILLALFFGWAGVILPMIRVTNTEVHTMMAR
jgi:ABC-type antimicrobial peptide transport system permease subunit